MFYVWVMKQAEVQLPDGLYQRVEELAKQLHVSVSEMLRLAAEQVVGREPKATPQPQGEWSFPEGRHLGAFRAPVEDWRLLANESATE
jgi:predicted transcriptional regulator